MVIDAVPQPQTKEEDVGKTIVVLGFVANASMLVRSLKIMGAFKVQIVKYRRPPLCSDTYQQYTNNDRKKSTVLANLRDKVKNPGIK